MKKQLKIILPILILLIITVVVLYVKNSWGKAESNVVKVEVEETSEKIETNTRVELNDMSEISGTFVSQNNSDEITSEIMFEIEGLQETIGKFKVFQIKLNVSENYVNSSIEVTIDPSSVYTANGMRDEALLGEGFFEVSKYPEIKFTSNQIIVSDTSYVAKGKLLMLGKESELSVNFIYKGKGQNKSGDNIVAFEGSFVMDRTQYGMSETVSIGNDVNVTFYTALVEKL